MGQPDSYVIRIYRRTTNESRSLAGVVQELRTGRQRPFGSAGELWAFLEAVSPSPPGPGTAQPREPGPGPDHFDEGEG